MTEQKWTIRNRDNYNTHYVRGNPQALYEFDDSNSCFVSNSLVEQLQSEAYEKGLKVEQDICTHHIMPKAIAEARAVIADELKLVRMRLNSICDDIPADRLEHAGMIVNQLRKLEQTLRGSEKKEAKKDE